MGETYKYSPKMILFTFNIYFNVVSTHKQLHMEWVDLELPNVNKDIESLLNYFSGRLGFFDT